MHGQMICMKCCRRCDYYSDFSGLFKCAFPDGTSTGKMQSDIDDLYTELRKVDADIGRSIGEEKEKMEIERRRLKTRIKTKERILQGYVSTK